MKRGYTSNSIPCSYLDGKPAKTINSSNYKHKLSKMAKPIIVDENLYFESINSASRFLGTSSSNLRTAINKNGKYKKHIVKYANQKPSQGNSDNSTLKGSTTNG